MKKLVLVSAIASVFAAPAFADLARDSATVSLEVAKFASLTGLNDFVLTTQDASGSAGATYTGSDTFFLESNAQVRVTLEGGNLTNGADHIETSYSLDGEGLIMDTKAKSVHKGEHTVAATAVLGDISAQQAGDYISEITLTVSAI
jgi:hypothetical protein